MGEYASLAGVVALVALGGAKLLGTTLTNGAIHAAGRVATP